MQIDFEENSSLRDSFSFKDNNSLKDERQTNENTNNNFMMSHCSTQTQQDSLSDSDPISISNVESSTDIPMPGQLKATDSLLLLNQIGNDNTIISKLTFKFIQKAILNLIFYF